MISRLWVRSSLCCPSNGKRFEPPFQRLLAFTRTTRFVEKAAEFGGYDITGVGRATYNSP